MAKKRKKRGRPRTGRDPMIGVRLPARMLKKIGKIAEARCYEPLRSYPLALWERAGGHLGI
jgi:hypothetical protein